MLLIFGFLLMVFLFVVLSALMGWGLYYIDLPSALLILVSLLFYLPVSKSGNILSRYIKTSFKKDHAYTKTELAALVTAAKHTGKFVMAVGGFGFVIGVTASLMNVTDAGELGPNLAVSLITLLYAIALSCFVFLPVQAWAENKINTLQAKEDF